MALGPVASGGLLVVGREEWRASICRPIVLLFVMDLFNPEAVAVALGPSLRAELNAMLFVGVTLTIEGEQKSAVPALRWRGRGEALLVSVRPRVGTSGPIARLVVRS